MGQKVYGRFFGLALFGVVSLVSTVSAEVRYTVTDLGALGGNYSIAFSINNSNQIVGLFKSESDPQNVSHTFLWQNGTMDKITLVLRYDYYDE